MTQQESHRGIQRGPSAKTPARSPGTELPDRAQRRPAPPPHSAARTGAAPREPQRGGRSGTRRQRPLAASSGGGPPRGARIPAAPAASVLSQGGVVSKRATRAPNAQLGKANFGCYSRVTAEARKASESSLLLKGKTERIGNSPSKVFSPRCTQSNAWGKHLRSEQTKGTMYRCASARPRLLSAPSLGGRPGQRAQCNLRS